MSWLGTMWSEIWAEYFTTSPAGGGGDVTSEAKANAQPNIQKTTQSVRICVVLMQSFLKLEFYLIDFLLLSCFLCLSYQTSWLVCLCLWGCPEPFSEGRCPYLTAPEKVA